jgi:hypothetical protein
MADIKFTVIVDTATGQASIKQFEGDVKNLGEEGKKSGTSFGTLSGAIVAGVAAYHAASQAVSKLTGFMKDCVGQGIEAEQTEAALANTLAITGREVDANKKHFLEYANQMQQATLFTDEQVEASQTLLLQLTNLDQKGIDQAVKGAAGLASVLKIDLQSATMMVAKAMEGNFAALGRYGIKIADVGTLEEKRAALLDKLGSFYKRAEGDVNTFGGSITQLSKSFSEFKEAIGRVILGSEILNTTIKFLSKTMADVTDKTNKSEGFFKKLEKAFLFLHPTMANYVDLMKKANAAQELALKSGGYLNEKFKRMEATTKETSKALEHLIPELKFTEVSTKSFADAIDAAIKKNMTFVDIIEDIGFSFEDMGETENTVIQDILSDFNKLSKMDKNIEKSQHDMAQKWQDDYEKSIAPTYEQWGDLLEKNYGYIVDYNSRTAQAFENLKVDLGDQFVQIGLGHKNLFEGMGLVVTTYANEIGGAMRKMAMDAIMEVGRQWIADKMSALSSLIKSVMKLPFPFNIGAVGGAIALVTALFAKIRAFEEGGIVIRPTMGMIGERGPEAVIPLNQQTINNYLGGRGDGRKSETINLDVYLGGELFEKRVIKIVEKTSDLGTLRIHPKAIRTR